MPIRESENRVKGVPLDVPFPGMSNISAAPTAQLERAMAFQTEVTTLENGLKVGSSVNLEAQLINFDSYCCSSYIFTLTAAVW